MPNPTDAAPPERYRECCLQLPARLYTSPTGEHLAQLTGQLGIPLCGLGRTDKEASDDLWRKVVAAALYVAEEGVDLTDTLASVRKPDEDATFAARERAFAKAARAEVERLDEPRSIAARHRDAMRCDEDETGGEA